MGLDKLIFALSIISVGLNIVGALLMFFNTPKVNSQVYLYTAAEMPAIKKRDERKNTLIQLGTILLVLGCVIQVIALLLTFVK